MSRLTLGIEFLDPDKASWTATRVGTNLLLAKGVDANPAHQVASSTFAYLDWNPSDHTQLVTRHARLLPGGSVETWAISSASSNIGGNGVEHFDPASGQWASVDGGAVMVAVGPTGQPWLLNKQGTIFNRSRGQTGYIDGTWQTVPGQATDMAVGGDGSVWAIGTSISNIGGNSISHYNPNSSSSWDQVDGGAITVAVGPDGQPWIVNAQNTIFRRTRGKTGYVDGAWQTVPGQATDIAVGGDGSVWAIGANPAANGGGNIVYHYNPNVAANWDQVDGGAVEVAVDANGQPWMVTNKGEVYNRSRGKTGYVDGAWNQLSPAGTATRIGVGGALS